jgi:2'-deoxynucleoside 5'-phosphate N-hydrolase
LKVYLSVPMITNRALDRARLMAQAIAKAGCELASPWVIGAIENPDPRVLNIFLRDKNGAQTSDILVADVSLPSTGVGMEIMAAYIAKKRIVLVAKKGSVVSRMLQHMDRRELIEFEDEDSMSKQLLAVLRRMRHE